MTIAAESLDFGSPWVTDSFEWPLRIANPSDDPVHIDRTIASCDCTSVRPGRLTVPSRGEADLLLTLNLASQADPQSLDSPFSARLGFVLAGGGGKRHDVTLQGTVRRPLVIRPASLSLSEELSPGTESPPQVLTIERQPEVVRVELTGPSDDIAIERREGDEAGHVETWDIHVRPTRRLGPFQHTLHVAALDEAGDELGHRSVSLSGLVAGDIRWSPAQVMFTGDAYDAQRRETVTITSAAGEAVEVVDIITHHPALAAAVSTATRGEGNTSALVELTGDLAQVPLAGSVIATVDILLRTAGEPDPVIVPVGVALVRFDAQAVAGTED